MSSRRLTQHFWKAFLVQKETGTRDKLALTLVEAYKSVKSNICLRRVTLRAGVSICSVDSESKMIPILHPCARRWGRKVRARQTRRMTSQIRAKVRPCSVSRWTAFLKVMAQGIVLYERAAKELHMLLFDEILGRRSCLVRSWWFHASHRSSRRWPSHGDDIDFAHVWP